jgi:hypothetical protein
MKPREITQIRNIGFTFSLIALALVTQVMTSNPSFIESAIAGLVGSIATMVALKGLITDEKQNEQIEAIDTVKHKQEPKRHTEIGDLLIHANIAAAAEQYKKIFYPRNSIIRQLIVATEDRELAKQLLEYFAHENGSILETDAQLDSFSAQPICFIQSQIPLSKVVQSLNRMGANYIAILDDFDELQEAAAMIGKQNGIKKIVHAKQDDEGNVIITELTFAELAKLTKHKAQ